MHRKKLVILRGGPSSEYDVSLRTGKSLIETLRENYAITDVIIDKQGRWYVDGFEKQPIEVTRHADLVFNALHGEYGEDGKVQQLLESLQVPFTGPRALSAALAMNKHQAKDLFKQFGLKTPIWRVVEKDRPVSEIAFDLYKTFVMPVIIKPINRGSSLGVSIARDFRSLEETLTSLFLQYDRLLVEEYIPGKQGTVAVIDEFRNEPCYACLPTEVCVPADREFLDYETKYHPERVEVTPGNFSAAEKAMLIDMAKKAHKALGLRHYSRADFIIHPRRGVYILEVNSLPDIGPDSLFARALPSTGASYTEFLEHVIALALRGK